MASNLMGGGLLVDLLGARHSPRPAARAAQASATMRLILMGLPVVRLRPAIQSAYAARLTPSAWAAVS